MPPTFVPSQRGGIKLFHLQHFFVQRMDRNNSYRCEKCWNPNKGGTNCPARAEITNANEVAVSGEHNHDPSETGLFMDRLFTQIDQQALQIGQQTQQIDTLNTQIAQQARRIGQQAQQINKLNADMTELKKELQTPSSGIAPNFGERPDWELSPEPLKMEDTGTSGTMGTEGDGQEGNDEISTGGPLDCVNNQLNTVFGGPNGGNSNS